MKILPIISSAALALAFSSVQSQQTPEAKPAAKPEPAKSAPTAGSASAAPGEVRNWADVDTNKDNLVSPEEMEKYLASAGKPSDKSPAKK